MDGSGSGSGFEFEFEFGFEFGFELCVAIKNRTLIENGWTCVRAAVGMCPYTLSCYPHIMLTMMMDFLYENHRFSFRLSIGYVLFYFWENISIDVCILLGE